MDFKVCTKCGVPKPVEDFHKAGKKSKDRLQSWCKPCLNGYKRSYRRGLSPDQKFRVKLYHLSRNYGIKPSDFERLIQEQDGLCAICQEPLQHNHRLHLDHDHGTGRVRGLLCELCNQGLGRFRDDPALLQAAIQYLGRRR